MTNWTPIQHIERLSDFVYAYTNEKNKYYQNEDLYQKIVKGLEYWYDVDSESDNWWHNQISEPQKLGVLLIQMRIGKKTDSTRTGNKNIETNSGNRRRPG